MLITMEDIRAGGGCAPGLRAFFARYGLDLKAFIRDGGIDAELLAGTGDALAIKIVRLAQTKSEPEAN
ncbi:tail protein [Pseudomonas phage VW-6B]|nr:tail protein [Pseudomonas phage VW-6B]